MMEYYKYSETYDELDVSNVIAPQCKDQKQHVFVTHDESTFYANDYQKYAWVENNESYCLPKSQGRSIMISEFQCPCHGTMRGYVNGKYVTSRVIFYPGAQYQGYWKCEHMLAQLRDEVIPLFKSLHPDMVGVFIFDQSNNHKAFSDTALIANNMNMNAIEIKDDTSSQGKFRDQSFYEHKRFDYAEQQKIFFQNKDTTEKIRDYQRIHNKLHPVSDILDTHKFKPVF